MLFYMYQIGAVTGPITNILFFNHSLLDQVHTGIPEWGLSPNLPLPGRNIKEESEIFASVEISVGYSECVTSSRK